MMPTAVPSVSDPPPAPSAAAETGSPAGAIPWLGIGAVLLGALISNITARLSSFGLADIRGAVHAGVDAGSWITTANTTAQMLITPLAVWAGSIFTPRHVLLVASLVFAAISLAIPWSRDLTTLLALQFAAGLASGCFVPLTLSYILARMPRRLWSYGIALYALNVELSLNISASIEGWYVDHGFWRWIFWQSVPLALGMAACLYFGMKPQHRADRIRFDGFGLTSFALGLALIYAGLDQGNRLDWLHSGLVWGLLLGGLLLLGAFHVHGLRSARCWLDLRVVYAFPLPVILLLVTFTRLAILSTAYLIPLYLGAVRGFRALQVGDAIAWVALPQLLLCPISGYVLNRVDARLAAVVGLSLIALACLQVAHGLTPLWGSREFIPSQLLQALGQSLALSGVIYSCVRHLHIESALTFGAMLQTARLFGGELGQAFMATFQRVREQHASNLIGLHVRAGDAHVSGRLAAYGRALAHTGGGDTHAAALLLGRAVRTMATTQGVIDGFIVLAASVSIAFLALAVLKPPRGSPPAGLSAGRAGSRPEREVQ